MKWPSLAQVTYESIPRQCAVSNQDATPIVNFRPECSAKGAIVDESNYRNAITIPGDVVQPLDWEPTCAIVVLRDESRMALFDRFIREGRRPTEPLKISFDFTFATSMNGVADLAATSLRCGRVCARPTVGSARVGVCACAFLDFSRATRNGLCLIRNSYFTYFTCTCACVLE